MFSGSSPHITTFYMGDGAILYLGRLKTALTTAGWSFTSNTGWTRVVNPASNPTDGQTITFGTQTYTFRTSVGSTADEVLIGSSALDTLQNLAYAVNADPTYSGVKFGSSTTANTTCRCPDQDMTSTATFVALDETDTSIFSVSESCNFNFATGTYGYGHVYKSGVTPDGNYVYFHIYALYSSTDYCGMALWKDCPCEDYDWTNIVPRGGAGTYGVGIGANSTLLCSSPDTDVKFWGTPYAFAHWLSGDSAASQYSMSVWVLKLNSELPSYVISNATNATPIEITTASNHPWSTSDVVTICGCQGNTAPNDKISWVIIKTAADKFTLTGSVGNGAYTSGGRVGGVKSDLTAACLCERNGWRQALQPRGALVYNQWGWNAIGMLLGFAYPSSETGRLEMKMYGDKDMVYVPLMHWDHSGSGTTDWYTGWLYDAVMMNETQSVDDDEWTDADGNVWFRWSARFTNNRTIWLLKTKA